MISLSLLSEKLQVQQPITMRDFIGSLVCTYLPILRKFFIGVGHLTKKDLNPDPNCDPSQ